MALGIGFYKFMMWASIFVGPIITIIVGWICYMRGAGKFGGGKVVIDCTALPFGGIRMYRIVKIGSLYKGEGDGNTSIVMRVMGLFSKEPVPIESDNFVKLDEKHFLLGIRQLKDVIGIHVSNQAEQNKMLRNDLAVALHALRNKTGNVDDIVEDLIKKLEKVAKAQPMMAPKAKR